MGTTGGLRINYLARLDKVRVLDMAGQASLQPAHSSTIYSQDYLFWQLIHVLFVKLKFLSALSSLPSSFASVLFVVLFLQARAFPDQSQPPVGRFYTGE